MELIKIYDSGNGLLELKIGESTYDLLAFERYKEEMTDILEIEIGLNYGYYAVLKNYFKNSEVFNTEILGKATDLIYFIRKFSLEDYKIVVVLNSFIRGKLG